MNVLRPLKFFLFEQDPLLRQRNLGFIQRLGYRDVEVFEKGTDCLEGMGRLPDVIFLSQEPAWEDSLYLMHQIQQLHPAVFLIFFSDEIAFPAILRALRAGAFEVLGRALLTDFQLAASIDRIATMRFLQEEQSRYTIPFGIQPPSTPPANIA